MSVQAAAWARSFEVGDPTAKAVLRSLADQANADGICWPSVASIAQDCELSDRTILRKVALLEDRGALHRVQRPGRSTVYQLHLSATPDTQSPHPCRECHPTPDTQSPRTIRNRKGTSSGAAAPREADLVWDALAAVFGEPTNANERGRRNTAVKLVRESLAAQGYEEADAARLARSALAVWRVRYPGATVTDTALANRWAELVQARSEAATVCDVCGIGGGMHAADCARAA